MNNANSSLSPSAHLGGGNIFAHACTRIGEKSTINS